MKLEFFLSMRRPPTVTHQEKRIHVVQGKPVYYEPPELKQARTDLTDRLFKFKPECPFTVGVRLLPVAFFRLDVMFQAPTALQSRILIICKSF